MGVYDNLLTPTIRAEIADARAGRPEFYTDPFDPFFGSSIATARWGHLEVALEGKPITKSTQSLKKTIITKKYTHGRTKQFTNGVVSNTTGKTTAFFGQRHNGILGTFIVPRIKESFDDNGMIIRKNVFKIYTNVIKETKRLNHSHVQYQNDALMHWFPYLRFTANNWMLIKPNISKMHDGILHNIANKNWFASGVYNTDVLWFTNKMPKVENAIITPSAVPIPSKTSDIFHPMDMVIEMGWTTKTVISCNYINDFVPQKIEAFIFGMPRAVFNNYGSQMISSSLYRTYLEFSFAHYVNANKPTHLSSRNPDFAAKKCGSRVRDYVFDALTKMNIILRSYIRGDVKYIPLREGSNLKNIVFTGVMKNYPALYKTEPIPPFVFGRFYAIITFPGERAYGRIYPTKN